MLRVGQLVELLSRLPPETCVYTAETIGINPAELGNSFPLKVYETPFCVALYIDDGLGDHGHVSRCWDTLDEYVESKTTKPVA